MEVNLVRVWNCWGIYGADYALIEFKANSKLVQPQVILFLVVEYINKKYIVSTLPVKYKAIYLSSEYSIKNIQNW